MKEKKIGKLLITYGKEENFSWHLDLKIWFFHTMDFQLKNRRLILEWG